MALYHKNKRTSHKFKLNTSSYFIKMQPRHIPIGAIITETEIETGIVMKNKN